MNTISNRSYQLDQPQIKSAFITLKREIDMRDNFAEDPFGPGMNDPIR